MRPNQMNLKTLAIHPDHFTSFEEDVIEAHKKMGKAVKCLGTSDPAAFDWDSVKWARPYRVSEGVLTIPIEGALVSGFPYHIEDWVTGYEFIAASLYRAERDLDVERIVFAIDSSGGHARGCFELVEYAQETVTKPMDSMVNGVAFSAAYAIACIGETITATKHSEVGSIGVVATHFDYSAQLAQIGITPTLIFAGAKKVDGHPLQPLSQRAKADIQSGVNDTYATFVNHVASSRGLTPKNIRNTEADTFRTDEALEMGLIDRVGREPIASNAPASSESNLQSQSQKGDQTMKDKDKSNPVDEVTKDAEVNDISDVNESDGGDDEPVAAGDTSTDVEDNADEPLSASAQSERQRIANILASEMGKKMPKAATHLAIHTDMTVAEVEAFLGELGADAQSTPADDAHTFTGFDGLMNQTDNPQIAALENASGEGSFADSFFNSVRGG